MRKANIAKHIAVILAIYFVVSQPLSTEAVPTNVMFNVIETPKETVTTVVEAKELVNQAAKNIKREVVILEEEFIEIDSVGMMNNKGKNVTTDVISLSISSATTSYSTYEFETYGREKEIATVYNIFTQEFGVPIEIVSAIIGNIIAEGHFGMEQGTYYVLESIEQAEEYLLSKSKQRGFGIIQWTLQERRNCLYSYYVNTYNELKETKDWNTIMAVAECAFLYEELKAYGTLDKMLEQDLQGEDMVERCTAILIKDYIKYSNYKSDFNEYECIDSTSSGQVRIDNALNVYRHYTGKQ